MRHCMIGAQQQTAGLTCLSKEARPQQVEANEVILGLG